jgi:glycosyltransferase involved in cell wall biosynthesis
MRDLSILIPARNEMFLAKTIEDILSNRAADTEVIAVLDGQWATPPIAQHERVNVVYVSESIGQRAATNIAANLSRAKYVMKADAHCAFDKGFDRKMIEAFSSAGDNAVMVPVMRNLHAYNWKCYGCGKQWYQANKPELCDVCQSEDLRMKMMWVPKKNPQSTSYCFDAEPHFQYYNSYTKTEKYRKDKNEKGITESMSIQGSCFMLSREKYHELNICDESFGNWGNQGIEVACKMWLSGGRVLINHHTWYAHLFRTNAVLHFPWPVSGNEQSVTKEKVKNAIYCHKLPKQIYPVSWLVEKFWPVKGWTEKDLEDLKKIERDNRKL